MQQVIYHPSNFAQHISCVEVNMAEERVICHPSHPEHWLSFFKCKKVFMCEACGKDGRGNGYECDYCNVDLHISCATLNATNTWVIQYPIDPGHCISKAQYLQGSTCDECGEKLGCKEEYGCLSCNFDLHKSCATLEIAEEKAVKHPGHTAHPLSFFKYKRGFKCKGCRQEGRGNGYGCALCNFDLHISCAIDAVEQRVTQCRSNSKHTLRYARYPRGFICSCCGERARGNGYGCVACDFDLHISCATFNMNDEQKPIEHPSHPEHSLSYVRYSPGFTCSNCKEKIRGNGFRCGACDFDLHVRCAKAPPKPDEDDCGCEVDPKSRNKNLLTQVDAEVKNLTLDDYDQSD